MKIDRTWKQTVDISVGLQSDFMLKIKKKKKNLF